MTAAHPVLPLSGNSAAPQVAAPTFATPVAASHSVLVVDDDRLAQNLLQIHLGQLGHRSEAVLSGEAALARLESLPPEERPAALLLDREMPGMGGLALVRQLKSLPALRQIPIVMLTGSQTPEQISEGIDAGVFYYLGKPIQPTVLASVLAAALRESDQKLRLMADLGRHQAAFALLDSAQMALSTLEQAEDAACFLAAALPNPERSVSGLAELLFNAVEHGNLGIGYAEKSELVAAGQWREEIGRRLRLPEYASKRVQIVYQKKNDGHWFQITDEGAGFDWNPYLRIDPARAAHNHGRGIATANLLAFDILRYQPPGNRLLAFIRNAATAPTFHW